PDRRRRSPLALRALALAHLPFLGRSRRRSSGRTGVVAPRSRCEPSRSLISRSSARPAVVPPAAPASSLTARPASPRPPSPPPPRPVPPSSLPPDRRRRPPLALRALALAHPLTAPADRPPVIRPCTRRKNTTTGIAKMVEPAIRPPQSVPCAVLNVPSQTGS